MEVASKDNYFGFTMTGPKVVVGFSNGVKMVRDDFDQVLLHFRSFENSLTAHHIFDLQKLCVELCELAIQLNHVYIYI